MAITLTREQFKQRYGQKGLDLFNTPEPQDTQQGFLSRAGSALKERAGELKKTFGERGRGEISAFEATARTFGDIAGGFGDIVGAAVSPQVEKLTKIDSLKPAFEALGRGMESYEEWKGSSETNRRVAEVLEATVNIVDLVGGAKVGGALLKAGKEAVETGVKAGVRSTENVVSLVRNKLPELGEKASQILASEPSEQVANILKNAQTSKLDEFLDIAKKSSQDFKATTGFEVVGDKIAEATKQINNQLKSLGSQKATILAKAKVGLEEFKDAPRRAILEVNRLADNPIKKDIIAKLKSIKTKADADKVIDDIQDIIFNATGTKTIAQGSRIEKQLRVIIGKMNGELKDVLPTAYRNLNDKFADNIDALQKLNKSLGDVVDGVPLRGASLVKQFFSPAGRTAKELFEFIKKNTGIDLAEDTVLAKFTAELFDDPKVRSLLEGLPRGRTGVIEKGLEILTEKSGVGGRFREAVRKGKIRKAKEITKP